MFTEWDPARPIDLRVRPFTKNEKGTLNLGTTQAFQMSEKVLQQFNERAAAALIALRALVNEKCEHDDKFSLGKTIFVQ